MALLNLSRLPGLLANRGAVLSGLNASRTISYSRPTLAGGHHHHVDHHEPVDPYYDNTPAPHPPGAAHSNVAYVMGTVLWLWIFWRAKQDADAMFGFRHPWEHAHH